MTICTGKMRVPLERVSKTAGKEFKMKNITPKKKKVRITKTMDESIAETISFVIKGYLAVAKKTNVRKRNPKAPAKNKIAESSAKKVPVPKKTVREVSKAKTAKKPTIKKNSKIKTTSKVIKSAISNRKSQKKNTVEALNTIVTSQGGIGKPALVNHVANKIKNEVKTSKSNKNDAKRRQSPLKGESVETVKQVNDEKPEVNIKKIKKSDNTNNKINTIHDKSGSKQKSETTKLKPDVKDKPKKNRVSSLEPKEVKDDVKPVIIKTPKNNIVKDEIIRNESETSKQRPKHLVKKQIKRKGKAEATPTLIGTDDTSSTSDEITLDELRQHHTPKTKSEATSKKTASKSAAVKKIAATKRKLIQNSQEKKAAVKPKKVIIKKSPSPPKCNKAKRNEEQRSRKLKLFSLWNSPKRHRVASLNALAKVHCLYENETRGALLDNDLGKMDNIDTKVEIKEDDEDEDEEDDEVPPTRTLRSAPGRKAVGKHWDMHDEAFSSSDENESSGAESVKSVKKNEKPEEEKKPEKKRPCAKKRRNRCELVMDLKDMVVRKRMASLNASAILAASYSVEKRAVKSPKSEDETDSDDSEESYTLDTHNKKKSFEEDVKKEEDRKVIEVQTTPNKKVSVILNQDTDVTITGVYVNSTTRSTHHEGYCSIAGMQYRISAKSHTQTASTTVATETILQSAANIGQENTNTDTPTHPCKSYTPLTALSSMQPPGTPSQHGVPLATSQHVIPHSAPQHIVHTSPIGRRHGCPSAFSAPPSGPYGPPPPAHHHHPATHPPAETSYIHGYYQPAGPLINVPPHGHAQPSSLGKPAPLSEVSSSPTPPPSHQAHSQSSTADSMDSDVIITSATTAKDALPTQQPPPTYRYSQYPAPHPGYSYSYPPQYYPAPSYHHELCYPPNPYLHHKTYPPPAYRRHLTAPTGTQYYQANPPDLYHPPPSAPSQQSQQVVSTNPVSSSSYQPSPSGPPLMESYPPPPTLVEPYPPPHYYPGYGPAPPPVCYTHSSPTRTIPYINAAYQSCPCPMQSCPKNVHTGPLIGDSKRSSHISSIAKDSLPLPPVALALPLEPVSATGPPSPARGSAGMPPPPSPAGATYQPPPPAPKQEGIESLDYKPIEKKRKARIGKSMVRNNIAANFPENTMLLMCHPPPSQHTMPVADVKRELESPQEQKVISEDLKTKEDASEITITSQTNIDALCMKTQIEDVTVPFMKTEDQPVKLVNTSAENAEVQEKAPEELLPCQKTVAENVKVKNMKRKLSVTRESEKLESTVSPPQKKLKDEQAKANGSYKDLIKKHVPSIRINNGKRKLNIESDKTLLIKKAKLKYRKNPVKRKSSPGKAEINCKRLKTSKPLLASNLHNSKQNLKSNKDKCLVNFALNENKEPFLKTSKRLQVNSKHSINNNNNNNHSKKKLAPAILDSLFAKNNVDRTIECVVSGYSDSLRTTKKTETSLKALEKCKNAKEPPLNPKSTNSKSEQFKPKVVVSKKVGASKRKTKGRCVDVFQLAVSKVPKKHVQSPRWSNGWVWKGEPFWSKVFLNSDETTTVRKCYPAMKHTEGDVIEPRDCVLLKAGQRKNELPFVAKVAALWENQEDGEMMMSLLWYYRPEHTDQGRQPYYDEPDEVFASRHKDTNSVACIEDKCYVLTFNEYCRFRKTLKKLEEGMEDTGTCIPNPEPYPRMQRQPPVSLQTSSDLIFFCRRVYDFRQKRIVKNPS